VAAAQRRRETRGRIVRRRGLRRGGVEGMGVR